MSITYKFLMVPDSSRDFDSLFSEKLLCTRKGKARLIQTITNQFPCQAYIQCWCPALERPRNAAHHCIWRELISLIQKYSTKKTEDKSTKAWSFPTANEQEAVHKEWTVSKFSWNGEDPPPMTQTLKLSSISAMMGWRLTSPKRRSASSNSRG